MLHELEIDVIVGSVVRAIKARTLSLLEDISSRVSSLEQRIKEIPGGSRGEKGDPGIDGKPGNAGPQGEKGAAGDRGEAGPKGDPGAEGAAGRDGKDGGSGLAGERGESGAKGEKGDQGEVGQAGTAGRDGIDGKEGQGGKPGVDGKDGTDGIQGKDGAPGRDGNDGKDGVPGPTGERGERGEKGEPGLSIKGDKGSPGLNGKDAEPIHPDTISLMVLQAVEKAVSAIPRAKDGEPGRDAAHLDILPAIDLSRSYPRGTFARHAKGLWWTPRSTTPGESIETSGWEILADGLAGFKTTQSEDLRSFSVETVAASGAKHVDTFSLPVLLYRGVHRDGDEYFKGDTVTWAGSLWYCHADSTKARPIEHSASDWTLAAKRGSSGKDGVPGKDSSPRPNGPIRA